MRYEIRFAGFGGQGIMLAGYLFGKAVTLYGGRQAILTQSYGPEARGGAAAAQLVITDTEGDYPLVEAPDLLVALSQEAARTYVSGLKPGGLLVVDADRVVLAGLEAGGPKGLEGVQVVECPFTAIADGLGRRIVANVVMLGFVAGLTGWVDHEQMAKTLRQSLPERHVPQNLKALDAGFQAARETEVSHV